MKKILLVSYYWDQKNSIGRHGQSRVSKSSRSLYEFVSPGETIKTNDFKEFLGGKGLNQSVAVSRSGSKIYHAGCINKNDEIIKKQLNEWGVDTSYIYDVDEPTR